MSIALEGSPNVASITTGNTLNLNSWSPGANELCLIAVAQRNESLSLSIAGNGLTWVEILNLDNAQGQCGISVFRAMGASPSSGAPAITIGGTNTTPVVGVGIRLSGVDTSGTNGSGAVEVVASDAGPPSTDNDDMKVSITPLSSPTWAIGFGTYRAGVFTTPGDQTTISINNTAGIGGDITTCSVFYAARSDTSAFTLGGDNCLNSARDWAIIGLIIKQAAAAGIIFPILSGEVINPAIFGERIIR